MLTFDLEILIASIRTLSQAKGTKSTLFHMFNEVDSSLGLRRWYQCLQNIS